MVEIQMVKIVKPNRTSYNIYLVKDGRRFLCNNMGVHSARSYAEGLRAILTPNVQIVERDSVTTAA